MKLCLVILGRVLEKDGSYYLDKKNMKAINRYTKYFDSATIIARKIQNKKESLYSLEKFNAGKDIKFVLYDGYSNLINIFKHLKTFRSILESNIKDCDFVISWAEQKTHITKKISDKYNKPMLIYCGGCLKDSLLSSKSFLKKILAFYLDSKLKSAVKHSNYVHYVTEGELQKIYPTNGKSIGASYVNIQNHSITKKITPSKKEWYSKEKIVIGLIGYLNGIKGIDTAIKALTRLDEKFVLRIMGGGNNKTYVKLAKKLGVSNRVFFDGTVSPGDEVYNWLRQIDIYIQPSRAEGLPRATIEAMSIGLPVISSNEMGLKELITDSYRHRKGDWKTLAKLINKMYNNYEDIIFQSNENYKKSKKYDREMLDKKIDDFYMTILKEINIHEKS